MTDKAQVDAELSIFTRFAGACPLAIELASIEKRNPPEPDILCRLQESGELVAFEMVEIIDQDWGRLTSLQRSGTAALRMAYESSPPQLRAALGKSLGSAAVLVSFRPEATAALRKKSLQIILEELSRISDSHVGVWRPTQNSILARTVRAAWISRGDFYGPLLDVDANTSIGDPTVNSVLAKCTKAYVTPHPIELLAFYELQPQMPEDCWKPRLDSVLEEQWATGPYRRVWLFDVGSRAVSYRAEARG